MSPQLLQMWAERDPGQSACLEQAVKLQARSPGSSTIPKTLNIKEPVCTFRAVSGAAVVQVHVDYTLCSYCSPQTRQSANNQTVEW